MTDALYPKKQKYVLIINLASRLGRLSLWAVQPCHGRAGLLVLV